MDNLMKTVPEGFPSQVLIRFPVETISRLRGLPLTHTLYPTDLGHFPAAANHYVSRPEGCPNFIFIYCVGGVGWCEIDGQRWTVSENQGILIPAGIGHAYGTEPGEHWRIHWVHFNGSEAAGLFAYMHESLESPLIFLPRPEPLVDAFGEMLRWTRRAHATAALIALGGSLARLIGLVIDGRRAMAGKARRVEERILLTIERMNESLHAPLQLDQLAAEARLSVAHYCPLFKKLVGTSPMRFYNQLRIRKACDLLSQTDLAIREVGEEVGFADPFYFSRTFKKVMGVSPSVYREDHPLPRPTDEGRSDIPARIQSNPVAESHLRPVETRDDAPD